MTIKPIIAGQVIPDMIQNLRVCRNICKNKQLQKHKKRPSVKIRTAAINIFLSELLLFFFCRKFRFHICDNEINPAFLS